MEKFAKIFESEKYGQILVTRDANDRGDPALCFSVMPPDLGICTSLASFQDTDLGYASRDTSFERVDLAQAERFAQTIFESATHFTPTTNEENDDGKSAPQDTRVPGLITDGDRLDEPDQTEGA